MLKIAPAGLLGLLLLLPASAPGQTVRFSTNLGDIDVTLLPRQAPLTVANFLRYVDRGAYDKSFFHRSVPGFIIQGGGFKLDGGRFVPLPSDPPVRNEFNVSNLRGTIAMAKLDGDPNSATNQWFFSLADNSRTLNGQNGGFTVFGRIVAGSAGLSVVDRIAEVPIVTAFPAPYNQLPMQNYTGGTVTDANLVTVNSITVLGPAPSITGVVSAGSFGGFALAAPGSYIEIYGANLAGETSRAWAASDFKDGEAPTKLENVSVTIGGQPAFVNFVNAAQVNVQVPTGIPTGGSLPVVVFYDGQPSAAIDFTIRPVAPGLLAPPAFKVGDKQYAVAVRPATGAFISNGSIPGLPALPAAPGETLLFYGIGFGAVTPASIPIAGKVVSGQATVAASVEFKVGPAVAQVVFAGMIPGLVGVYQFNVTIPTDAPSGDLALEVKLDGTPIAQTLWIPVQR
ncbi:MAG: peptidylprolyl isomerase [Acidobacteriia bacterium]|nr:peptidylprolyl isomerase [Terriglobia bacterium]